jgi:Protein of unknown function (DUF998)
MTTQTATAARIPGSASDRTCTPAARVTKSLLGYGVLAGVVFEASILIQGLTRHGFRLAHHDASLLSNGPLGWIQIATFLIAGAMTVAAAAGMRRALAGRPGGTWGPWLIAVYGAGLMAAGPLYADPAYGFGPGAPAGKAIHISWHGAGHLISASIGFTALIVACFVVARYFSRARQRGLAVFSRVTGLTFLAAFAGVTTGSSASAIVVPFHAAVLLAWTWIAVTCVYLHRRTEPSAEAGGR